MNRDRFGQGAAIRASAAFAALVLAIGVSGCKRDNAGVAGEGARPPTLTSASPPAVPSLDANAITAITGGTPETSGNVVKVNFPRTDIPVQIDGWKNVPPYMGLTSYVAFMPHAKDHAMAMGDVVLFEDEVNPAMSAALDHGLEVTALHNHFFFDKPKVYFMHLGGMGSTQEIAAGVKAVMEAVKAVRERSSAPRETFGGKPPAGRSHIDPGKLDGVFGSKGKTQDGMYKVTFGRSVNSAMCGGCALGSAMGINTWAAFAGTDQDAIVDGDFAIVEDELQPVLKTLRLGGINIVAIHSHTMGETPRVLFFHYWGRGPAVDLAKALKAGLDKTAWEGRIAR